MNTLYCINCHTRTPRNFADERVFDGIYCERCAPKITGELPRVKLSGQNLKNEIKELLGTAPALGVTIQSEIVQRFDEERHNYILKECLHVGVDPDALRLTAEKNAKLMDALAEAETELESLRSKCERLTPKKPEMRAMDGFDIEVAASLCCPTCKGPVTNYWVHGVYPKHCQFCGQAIDWEEQNYDA